MCALALGGSDAFVIASSFSGAVLQHRNAGLGAQVTHAHHMHIATILLVVPKQSAAMDAQRLRVNVWTCRQ